jgi:adenylosuccinate synthase
MKGETTWQALSLPEEHTTVTKKVRRVGEWDGDLVRQAVAANGAAPVVRVALTMIDSYAPQMTNYEGVYQEGLNLPLDDYIRNIEDEIRAPVRMVTTSPINALWRR